MFDYPKLNFYQILEAAPNATASGLKQAYLRAAKRYHPDVYRGKNATHF